MGQRLNVARDMLALARTRRSGDENARRYAGFRLLDESRRIFTPDYRLTEHLKSWFHDDDFFDHYRRFHPNDRSADRKFFLRQLMKLVDPLEGDTAEAGVYTGASSWFICQAREARGSTHWAFDSFEGLSRPTAVDGSYWEEGGLEVAEESARTVLGPYRATVLKGWIPEVFGDARIERLVFSHLDVDLYEPTKASLEFFYPLTVPGGLIVCDDYGFDTCPGARRAVDDYMAGRPEPVLHCPTGQGIIIKR